MQPKMESYMNQRECRAMRYTRPTESTMAKSIDRKSIGGANSKGNRTRSGSKSVSKSRRLENTTAGDIFSQTRTKKIATTKRTRMTSLRG